MLEERPANKRILQLQADIQRLAQDLKNSARHPADIHTESLEELFNSLEALWVAEEELLAAHRLVEIERQRYQDLFEFAPDGYLITDLNGRILEANRSAAALLHVPQTFLVGKMLPQFIPLEERQAFRQRLNELRRAMQTELLDSQSPFLLKNQRELEDLEVRLQPRHSAPIHASMRAAFFHQDQGDFLRWAVRDITERVATQKALQDREIQFRILAETSSIAIFLLVKGQVEYANPSASRITSLPLPELVGAEFDTLIHPAYRSRFRLLLEGAAHPLFPEAPPPASIRQELKLTWSDGEERWVDMTAGLVILEDQPAWVLTAYDVTTRVQAEKNHRELSRQILNLQEEERRRISRELHDQMGQNLTALTLGLNSLEDAAARDLAHLKTLHRLQAIVNELSREVHRIAYELRPSALDDIGLASTISNYLEEWSEQYGIEVDMESRLEPELPLPPQTTMAIFRIVQEAFTNILKHAQATRASLVIDHRADQLRVIIEDNGIGFDPEEVAAKRILPAGHLGLLGMAERAELAGGSLQIESSPGQGTTLYLTFPISG